jgi:hypothetical protein
MAKVNYAGMPDSDDNLSGSDVQGERAVIPKHPPTVSKGESMPPKEMKGTVMMISKVEKIQHRMTFEKLQGIRARNQESHR